MKGCVAKLEKCVDHQKAVEKRSCSQAAEIRLHQTSNIQVGPPKVLAGFAECTKATHTGPSEFQRGLEMAYLLMFVTLLHLITLAILFIATMEKSWWEWDGMESSDLWYNCRFDNTTGTRLCASTNETEWLQAVQVLMVLSVVFSSVSFLVFLGQLFTMSKGGLFYFTGLCQVFAGLTVFSAALIYTLHNQEILPDSKKMTSGHFGYCFFLAWVCVPMLLSSGVIYIHLRKKE